MDKLKLNNTMGPNKLGNRILNKLANGLKKCLHFLCNTIASKLTYSTMWKRSVYSSQSPKYWLERLIFDKISNQIFKQLHERKPI